MPAPIFPPTLTPELVRSASLRYGENPHQRSALYRDLSHNGASIPGARQRHGKELSYNNIADAAAALGLAVDLARTAPGKCAAVIVKHANPCGAALADSPRAAFLLAHRGDPLAAYGGVLALGAVEGSGRVASSLDLDAAEAICREGVFLEVIAAGSFEGRALERLRARSASLRLLEVGPISAAEPNRSAIAFRSIPGGALAQTPDEADESPENWTLRAGPEPGVALRREAYAVTLMAKALSSNAIALGGPDAAQDAEGGGVRLFGAGAGQMDRVTACRLALEKAGASALGAIAAGDAFFPFPDGPALLIDAGVRLIVHPGGSRRDQETIDLCAARGVTLLTTGVRHFRH